MVLHLRTIANVRFERSRVLETRYGLFSTLENRSNGISSDNLRTARYRPVTLNSLSTSLHRASREFTDREELS